MRAPYRVQRFRCLICERTFSTQTFRGTYWQKRPDLDGLVQESGHSCAGDRQMAMMFKCAHTTIAKKIERLGRQAMRFHAEMMRKAPLLTGDVVFDGFASFEYAQYFPYWMNLAVHRSSGMALGFTESAHRRRGTMTAKQREKRAAFEAELG